MDTIVAHSPSPARRAGHPALRIAGVYATLSTLWILFSDTLLGALVKEPDTLTTASILKGWGFVLATTLLLYALIRRLVGEIQAGHAQQQALQADKLRTLKLLDTIIEGSTAAIFVKDDQGRYTLINQAGCALLRKPAAELVGREDGDIFSAADAAANRAADRAAIAAAEPITFEEVVNINGHLSTFETTKGAVRDEHGRVVGVFGIAREITAQRAAEAALQRQAQMLIESQRVANVGSCAIDLATGQITWSAEIYRLFGVAAGAGGHDFSCFLPRIHPDDRAAVRLWSDALLAGSPGADQEFRILRAEDGRELIARGCGAVVGAGPGAGVAARTIATVQDVTEHKRAEGVAKEGEARYRLLFESNPNPMWVFDHETLAFLAVNDAAVAQYGYSREEFLSMASADIRSPEDVPKLRSTIANVAAGVHRAGLWRHRRKDGSEILVDITFNTLDFGGRRAHAVLASDVTERERALAELQLNAKVFEQGSEGIVICNSARRIITANRAICEMTGYDAAEMIGNTPALFKSGRHDRRFYRDMWQRVASEGRWQGEVWNRRKSGELYPVWQSISSIRDSRGEVTHYVGIGSDISARKEAEARILRLAHYDALTGLPNRTLLNDRIERAIALSRRGRNSVALLFVDLDRFKNVNDSLGHPVGDQMLIEIAKRLQSEVRAEDTVSRLGGDEFILLLPDADADGAAHVAEKILCGMGEPLQIGALELSITPSIGIALYPADGRSIETLVQRADAAMYQAKQAGRNTFRFFTAEMQMESNRTLHLENALRRALTRDQLRLVFQPQVDIRSGQVIGCEALLRWHHPELGMVSPAEFIPIAEDSGQILSIGEWVLRTAVAQNRKWQEAGLPRLVMAVNISAIQFNHADFTNLVTDALREGGLAPECLELELTESIAMGNPEIAVDIIDRLDRQGVKMSIDDFGTGYSSLSCLKRLNVAKLKIDQSFVQDIARNADSEAIVCAVINLAAGLGLNTIAEGVETEHQLAFLREKGCEQIQGYYVSKPLSSLEFEKFLRASQASSAAAWAL
jgi:diguanylate cyclase (GGDEF)-like protein/PAS domain S-box-containing protein